MIDPCSQRPTRTKVLHGTYIIYACIDFFVPESGSGWETAEYHQSRVWCICTNANLWLCFFQMNTNKRYARCRPTVSGLTRFFHYIGCSKKMAQLLISHKVQSGLQCLMKLHTRQLQHVYSELINFQLNQIKNMEIPDVLKKGVWKFNK